MRKAHTGQYCREADDMTDRPGAQVDASCDSDEMGGQAATVERKRPLALRLLP